HMPLEKCRPRQSYVDVLDRVLDKGLVIDVRLRVSVAGIEGVGMRAEVVVASIQTYIKSHQHVKSSVAVAGSRDAASARRRCRPAGRLRTFYRCQHGCTFVLRRRSEERTILCPFDGSRACEVTPAPLA